MSEHVRMRLLTLLVFLVACVKQLPPAETPAPIAPPVSAGAPPPNGYGRLVVDVVDGPIQVQRIQMVSKPVLREGGPQTFRFFEEPQILCSVSPCVADVPLGNILLGFPELGTRAGTDVELVNVGPDPSVYRRALSLYEDQTGGVRIMGIIATSVGTASAITGAALLPIGLSKDNGGMTTAGGLTLGIGAALIAIGVWAIRHDAPVYRPGSSNHFPLAAQP